MGKRDGASRLQPDVSPWIEDRLNTLAREVLESFPVAGGVVTISTRDGVFAETCFGYADIERSIPTSPERLYEIGSISKVFAGIVIAQLAHEGSCRLDEPIGDILPWTAGTIVRADATVRDLLNHTSGAVVGADAMTDDPGEIWNARAARPSIVTPPRFHYSNLGYQILGEVVLSQTGTRMVEQERRRVLGPLSMLDAVTEVTHGVRSKMAVGYWPERTDQPWAPGDPLSVAPWFETDSVAGNIAANAADMVRLTGALLGASSGEPLVDETGATALTLESFELITSTLAPQGEPFDSHPGLLEVTESRYGVGINVARIGDSFCVTHGGGMVGYSTFMLVDCTLGFAVTALTSANGDCHGAQLLARAAHSELSRRLSGEESPAIVSLRSIVAPNGKDGLPFSHEHLGRFTSERDGTVMEVLAGGHGSPVTIRLSDGAGRLYRLASGRFVSDHPKLRRFLLDAVVDPDGTAWIYGDVVFSKASMPRRAEGLGSPLVGRYRSFSPWYPEFRIIERHGVLFLVAGGGTEAPDADEELVELSSDCFRIGGEDWLPERLYVGPVQGGRVVAVNRDGCLYARAAGD
ncbi:MAG: serine hydrolase domain-containing protein [Acidimicrobiales bacterium]